MLRGRTQERRDTLSDYLLPTSDMLYIQIASSARSHLLKQRVVLSHVYLRVILRTGAIASVLVCGI